MTSERKFKCLGAFFALGGIVELALLLTPHRRWTLIQYFLPLMLGILAIRYWFFNTRAYDERRLDELELKKEREEITPEKYVAKHQEIVKSLKDSSERQLDELELQKENHEITPEEYAAKRQEILKDL